MLSICNSIHSSQHASRAQAGKSNSPALIMRKSAPFGSLRTFFLACNSWSFFVTLPPGLSIGVPFCWEKTRKWLLWKEGNLRAVKQTL